MLCLKLLKHIPPYIDVVVWNGGIPQKWSGVERLSIKYNSAIWLVEYSSPLNINTTIDFVPLAQSVRALCL